MQTDWRRLRFAPFVLLGILAIYAADYAVRGPGAKQRQAAIERQLRLIADPRASVATAGTSGFKTSGGYANRFCKTSLDPVEINFHYRQQLEGHGWFYYQEKVVQSHRREIYCNGSRQAAVLVLPQGEPKSPYEYSLTMSWNGTEGCS